MRQLEEYVSVGQKRLRCGYTTGTCAAAAARAAAELLLRGEAVPAVTVSTPAGIDVVVEVEESESGEGWAECAVRKDAGDDPDVTDGVLVFSRVEFCDSSGVHVDGGVGVGRVTREGLDQPVGAAAINSTPRRMIVEQVEDVVASLRPVVGGDTPMLREQIEGVAEAVRLSGGGGMPVLKQSCFGEMPTGHFASCGTARGHTPSAREAASPRSGDDGEVEADETTDGCQVERRGRFHRPAARDDGPMESAPTHRPEIDRNFRGGESGLLVTVSIPAGVELAARTFNPRLGIEGGISVIGTSGIVKPMSEEALIASIELELKMMAARGVRDVLVVPGNYGRDFADGQLELDLDEAVSCSNFFGATLDAACRLGFESILLVGHIGKMAKVAGGIMNTHSRVADCRVEVIAAHAALSGASRDTVRGIMGAATTDAVLDVLDEAGLVEATMASLMESLYDKLRHRVGGALDIEAVVFSNVRGVLGKTPNADALLDRHVEGSQVK